MLSIFIHFLLTIEVVVSLLIILVVLMQRPKSEGLGAAFGGGMTEQFWGAQTTNVLAKFTRWLGGIFFALTLILSVLYAKQSASANSATQHLLQSTAPLPASARTGTSGSSSFASAPPVSSGSDAAESLPSSSAAPATKMPRLNVPSPEPAAPTPAPDAAAPSPVK